MSELEIITVGTPRYRESLNENLAKAKLAEKLGDTYYLRVHPAVFRAYVELLLRYKTPPDDRSRERAAYWRGVQNTLFWTGGAALVLAAIVGHFQ